MNSLNFLLRVLTSSDTRNILGGVFVVGGAMNVYTHLYVTDRMFIGHCPMY